MKAPAIVSGDGSAPSVSAGSDPSRTRTLRNDGARAASISSSVEVELVGSDADEPDVEDEVRIGLAAQASRPAPAGWSGRSHPARASRTASCRPAAPRPLTVLAAIALVELDEQHLAGAILVERHGLGGAGVGVRDGAGLADLGRVPVAEREVVEVGRGDLVGRDDDLVAVGLARDGDGAVDHADPPRGGVPSVAASRSCSGLCGARFVANTGPWMTTSHEGRWIDGWSGSSTVTKSSSGPLPASVGRS